ncbi:hypothetical protein [Desulfobacter curvatus]|nr:hypothetical protein [Desulfobacter curvatus]
MLQTTQEGQHNYHPLTNTAIIIAANALAKFPEHVGQTPHVIRM